MNRLKYIRLALIGALILVGSEALFAQKYYNQNYTPKRNVGSSRTSQGVLQQGFSFGLNAIYYFGDVDVTGGSLTVIKDMTIEDISASGFFAYHMPFSKHFGMRYTGTVGLLRADNTKAWKNDVTRAGQYRKFRSVFLQPAAGVEVYPIDEYGLYFYLGLAVSASYFLDFKYNGMTDSEKPVFSVLPMGQFSLGYTWNLTTSWQIGLHGMLQMGFLDKPNVNLDGYPFRPSSRRQFPDGWFEIGISVYYQPVKQLPFFRH